MQAKTILAEHWHFVAAVLAGAMSVGALRADVAELKQDQTKVTADHDVLVELRTHQREQDHKLDSIDTNLNRLVDALRRMPSN